MTPAPEEYHRHGWLSFWMNMYVPSQIAVGDRVLLCPKCKGETTALRIEKLVEQTWKD